MDSLKSTNAGKNVELFGFERADDVVDMISWLGLGRDFRNFITSDVEAELYRQVPGSQLLSVRCDSEPDFQTFAASASGGSEVVVNGLKVTFPLTLRVTTPQGDVWRLGVQFGYDASDINQPNRRKILVHFNIVTHEAEKESVPGIE